MDALNVATGLKTGPRASTAVTGLINGLLAGVAMLGYLIVAMGLQGECPRTCSGGLPVQA